MALADQWDRAIQSLRGHNPQAENRWSNRSKGAAWIPSCSECASRSSCLEFPTMMDYSLELGATTNPFSLKVFFCFFFVRNRKSNKDNSVLKGEEGGSVREEQANSDSHGRLPHSSIACSKRCFLSLRPESLSHSVWKSLVSKPHPRVVLCMWLSEGKWLREMKMICL